MTGRPPLSAMRQLRLLIGLQLRRLVNQFAAVSLRWKKKTESKERKASAGKGKLGWLFAVLISAAMVFTFSNLSWNVVANMQRELGTVAVAAPPAAKLAPGAKLAPRAAIPGRAFRRALPAASGHTVASPVLNAMTLEALLFVLAVMLTSLAAGELAQADWDLEWQVALPVGMATLLAARMAGKALASAQGYYFLLPFLSVVAWISGYRVAAPLLGLAATLPLLLLSATLQALVDTGLRLRLRPPALRNLQALIGAATVVPLFLALAAGTPGSNGYVLSWAPRLPDWIYWLPPRLAVDALTSLSPARCARALGLLIGEAGLFAAAGVLVLMWQLRLGVAATGGRESGRRLPAKSIAREPSTCGAFLTPIQAREIRLLGRDRNFLMQTTIMPLLLIGGQLVLNPSAGSTIGTIHQHPMQLAAIAFAIAAYTLMFSAFQTINTEGQALWILYCVPHNLQSILRQKAMFWCAIAMIFPAAMLGFAIAMAGGLTWTLGQMALITMIGVPIFATISTSLGVFSSDPLAQQAVRRVRSSYLYLYMLLASCYAYAFFIPGVFQRGALVVLMALLAFALWQKAGDHLPYLLDPSASPPARVSVSDGLMAAVLFFILQILTLVILGFADPPINGRSLLIAFSLAGAVTFALFRFSFWRLKSHGVPRTFGAGGFGAVATGVLGGVVAACAAAVYLKLAAHTWLFERVQNTLLTGREDVLIFGALAVVAAPIFEEFIFRGLIFGGLRRTLGVGLSVVGSAAIFALVHPPAAVIPVFGLGLVAALVYERSKLLIGPLTAHAVYNAAVIGLQFMR